ncbi:MAG: OPT family oligopeptide transporter [Gammaproteobacteria bacterium]
MTQSNLTPVVAASQNYPELTLKVIILGFLLAVVLAASNAYLGLKVGRTVSGSIPAAVISIAVLHWFRRRNILEHNIVQTAASAGECLASGVVYTIPALLMLGVWTEFSYLDTLLIAVIGGGLGVLFSVPLRRTMLIEQKLPYPEGIAVAEILKASENSENQASGTKYLLSGGILAALFTLCQTGFKIIGESVTVWTNKLGVVSGFGFGFSPILLAAGYIVGISVTTTMLLGNIVTWQIALPILSWIYPEGVAIDPTLAASTLYKEYFRYASIGAITFGGLWGLITLYKPMLEAVKTSFGSLQHAQSKEIIRTERDIPMPIVLGIVVLMTIPLFLVFQHNVAYAQLPITPELSLIIVVICTTLAIVLGFIASSIAAYLVGLVGTTSMPISGLAIASITFIAVLLMGILGTQLTFDNPEYATRAAGITIIFAAIICLCASLGGDNMQDLRAGLALGATPWKQQIILFVGVVAGAIVIVPVLNLLFNAYGIGDLLPRPGMDPEKVLLAPQATMMAAVSEGVFLGKIISFMFGIGAVIALIVALLDRHLEKINSSFRLPVLAFALGMYLPMPMVAALFVGGVLSFILQRQNFGDAAMTRGILVAAGLIAGEALTGIILAIPFSLSPVGENALALPLNLSPTLLAVLGLLTFCGLIYLIYASVKEKTD